ncbi:MAG: radical SAM family heme chaperone HemW, partial [Microcoleaceae cyanobacterium]
AFARYYQVGESPLPSDESAAIMYRLAQQVLTAAGYKHYEISNYAKPGYECKHNYIYWQNQSYYGFGMGAASYVDGIRYTRPRKTTEYYEWVKFLENQFYCLEKDEQNVKLKNSQRVKLSESNNSDNSDQLDYLLETLMLKLRLAEGININTLCAEFGLPTWQKVWQCLLPFYQSGWVEIFDQEGKYLSLSSLSQLSDENIPTTGRICFSDPEGFLFSNTILSTLFSQLDSPERVAS